MSKMAAGHKLHQRGETEVIWGSLRSVSPNYTFIIVKKIEDVMKKLW